MSSNEFKLLGFSVMGVVFGFGSFGKGFMTLRRKRLIENTPTSKVRSLAMGLCELYGEIAPYQGKLLKSPFFGADCFYYRYEVEEWRSSGKRSQWVTIKEGLQSVPFSLKDETGEVVVDANNADVDIPQGYIIEPDGDKAVTPCLAEFMAKEELKLTGFLGFSKKLRFCEYYIAPKDKLYVLGTAGDNPHVDDGTTAEGFRDIMIQKGDKGQTFYISDKSEKECLNKLGDGMYLQIYGGGALFIGSLAYILFKFNFF